MTTLSVTRPTHYDLAYRILHWVLAALIFLMFFAILGFASVTTEEEHLTMLIGHSSMGTIISMLIVMRVLKRFVKRDPTPKLDLPKSQHLAARTVQYGLYFMMLWVPVTGYLTARVHELPVMAFGSINYNVMHNEASFELLRQLHAGGIRVMMLLLVLHVGAALFHKFVKKDGVMASMTRGAKKG